MKIEIDATDIIEHLPTLAALSAECDHITEMGVRNCVSTWAFIEGLAKTKGELVSIDINRPPEANLKAVEDTCKELGVKFSFVQGDTRIISIEDTDLLFIDTDHTKKHLAQELELHNRNAKKYIVLHDTESAKELWQAIGKLLWHGIWKVKFHHQNNNGLTCLERTI